MNLRKNTSKLFALTSYLKFKGFRLHSNPCIKKNIAHGSLKPELFAQAADNEGQTITLSDTCITRIEVKNYHKAQRAVGNGHYIAPELAKEKLA